MYQEEKLAGDVYEVLAEQYDLDIFDKIAISEDKHVSAIANLLINVGVDIEVVAKFRFCRVYNMKILQALYDTLIDSRLYIFRRGFKCRSFDRRDLI